MHALDEMILYEAALFAEARTIWELRKRSVPAHHFNYENETGTAGIIEAPLFHEVLGSSQSIQYDHGATKDVKVYNVAKEGPPFREA